MMNSSTKVAEQCSYRSTISDSRDYKLSLFQKQFFTQKMSSSLTCLNILAFYRFKTFKVNFDVNNLNYQHYSLIYLHLTTFKCPERVGKHLDAGLVGQLFFPLQLFYLKRQSPPENTSFKEKDRLQTLFA